MNQVNPETRKVHPEVKHAISAVYEPNDGWLREEQLSIWWLVCQSGVDY